MHPLRDYQIEIIQCIEDSIAEGYRRIMLQLPTGAGKTRCFVELAKYHRNSPYNSLDTPNCLIVAHRKELIDQAVEALVREQVKKRDIGIIKANEREDRNCVIQVASIQSLIRRSFPRAGLVIIDEAHHAMAESYQTVIKYYKDAVIIGVTATPARTDGSGFKDSFDILIEGPTIKELTAQGHLCAYKLYAYTRDKINTSYVRTQAGDYKQNDLADAVMNSEVRADLVETWRQHALGKRTVVFAVNVKLSKEYADLYTSSGYKAEHIDGNTPKQEREAILDRFKKGTTKILCNCNIVTEGFDLPEMECVQVVRPTQSLILWLQMVGRSLRTSQGKTHAIILDHTDNYRRLGLPDSDREWSLDRVEFSGFGSSDTGRSGTEDERRQREIQHREGELVEIANNSNLQIPIISMKTVRIDNVDWEIDSRLAVILSQKLKRLEELEKLLAENEIEEILDLSNTYKEALETIQNLLDDLPIIAKKQIEDEKEEDEEEEEDHEEEISNCTESIRLNSDNPIAYNNRGDAKYFLEDYQGAIADYTQAIHLDPDYTNAYINRGIAKYFLEDYQGEIADYTQAIHLNPEAAFAYYMRGMTKSKLGDNYGALEDFRKVASLFQKQGDTNQYQEAVNHIDEITESINSLRINDDEEGDEVGYYDRGRTKYALKDYQGAITEYTKAIHLDPEYTKAYNNRGIAKYALKDYQGAVADYTQAIHLDPEYAAGYSNRGSALSRLGEKSKALADFKKAASLFQKEGNIEHYQKTLKRIAIENT